MSASKHGTAVADRVMRDTIDRLAVHPAQTSFLAWIVRRVNHAMNAGPAGTMRAWMEANNGATVSTIQVDLSRETSWCPTGRAVDATRAGSVRLSGSTRDYAGCRVVHVTEWCLIVEDGWRVIAYVLETGAPE